MVRRQRPKEQKSPEEELQAAKDYAFRLMGYKNYSEAEVRQRLERRGHSPAVTEQVLAMLRGYGYLNDQALAEQYVQSHKVERGRRALARDLARRGVSARERATALEQVTLQDELAAARQLIARRLKLWGALKRERRLRRIHDLLVRRGFDFEVVNDIMSEFAEDACQ
ncbi:MAG: RecX family transcriptional regulator [Deinococcus sp.]|nr:RecX family transcriptional regulator [Deinococcus sp.]